MKLSEHLKLNLPIGENSVHISVLTENFKKLDDSYKYTIDKVDAVEHLIENVDFSEIEEQIEQLENKLNSHTRDNNNPHRVTKHQIGLNKVDNTADIDKPVSKPTEERLKDFWGKDELELGGRNLTPYTNNAEQGAFVENKVIGTPYELTLYTISNRIRLKEPVKINGLSTISIHNNDYMYCLMLYDNDLLYLGREDGFVNWRKEPITIKHTGYIGIAVKKTDNSNIGLSGLASSLIKLEKGNIPTDWTPAPEDIQAQIDEVIQLIEDIPEVFHDLPQNEVKEEMTPAEFDYGVTLCSQSLITDFPSINEYGVSYTIIGKHSNYVQLFITRFGDIWSRRSSARSSWNGEWYNSKRQIDFLVKELNALSKELDTVKQSGVEINKRISDKLNLMKIEASDTDSISENVTKIEDIPVYKKLNTTLTTQGGKQNIPPGYYEGGEVKAQFNNLIPNNVRIGVNIGDVIGTFQGERVKVIPHERQIVGYQGNIKHKIKFDSWITPIGYVLVIDGKIWTYDEAPHFSESGYALGTGSINLSFRDDGEVFSVTSSADKENGTYVATYDILSENRGTCQYVAYWFCYY